MIELLPGFGSCDVSQYVALIEGWVSDLVGTTHRGYLIVGAVLMLMLLAGGGRQARWRRRDPQRLYDPGQRAEARALAGDRCEYSAWVWWRRCTRPAQEIDHFYPWARGGATSSRNAVAACRRHNRTKGGRQPSALTATVIGRRRRAYWPAGAPRRPGQWHRPGRARWRW